MQHNSLRTNQLRAQAVLGNNACQVQPWLPVKEQEGRNTSDVVRGQGGNHDICYIHRQ